MTAFNGQAAEHPALTAAKSRLEQLERRTPPGYPLGYSMHVYSTVCTGCGSVSRMSQLWTITRAGSSSRAYHPSSSREKMYDLPVEFVKKDNTTPRCEACVGLLAREAVPALPPYHASLKEGIHKHGVDRAMVALGEKSYKAKEPTVEIDLQALGLLDD